jgi:hypothetical protein
MTNQAQMYIYGSAPASSGNVYLVGLNNNATPTTAIVVKLDSTGAVTWARKLNVSAGNTQGFGIAIDSSENVYVCGTAPNAGNTLGTGFLVKYNSSGTIQWQRALVNNGNLTRLNAVAVDNSGNVIVGGRGGVSTSNALPGLLLVKYNSSGTLQWQKAAYTSSNANVIKGLACDSSDNIYASGSLGAQTANYAGKFNSSGTLQWDQQWSSNNGGDGQELSNGIGVDLSGNVYYGGQTSIGSGVIGYMVKTNSSGTVQFTNSTVIATNSGLLTGFVFSPDQTMQGATYYNGVFNYILKTPSDGSKTGTYSAGSNTNITYSTGYSRTTTSLSLTYVTATQTDSAGILTDAAATFTLANAASATAVTTI